MIVSRERKQIGDLLAFGIDNAQDLPPAHFKGVAALGVDLMTFQKCHGRFRCLGVKGHRQSSGTGRPEYCRASEIVPKFWTIGLMEP